MAKISSTIIDGSHARSTAPPGKNNARTVSRPSEGIARNPPDMATATARPRPVCPMNSPNGTAMRIAGTRPRSESHTCSHIRWPTVALKKSLSMTGLPENSLPRHQNVP